MSPAAGHIGDSVLIRRAEPRDTVALDLLLSDDCYPIDLKQINSAGASPSERFIYLIEDTKPFGLVAAGPSDLGESRLGQISALYLATGYRDQGMGRKLLVRGLSVLRLRNFEYAHIWVNDQTKQPFASLGFEPDGSRRDVNREKIFHQIGYRISLQEYF